MSTAATTKIVADVTFEPSEIGEIGAWLVGLGLPGVLYTVLREHGPAGGWPEVGFSGTKAELTALCIAGLGIEPGDIAGIYPQLI